MPELPEVETVVRDLRPLLLRRRITSVVCSGMTLRRPWKEAWNKLLLRKRITSIDRRGKWIIICAGRDLRLLCHLGMTGQMTVVSAGEPLLPHTHIVMGLGKGRRELRFRDIRRFGSMSLFRSPVKLEEYFAESGLGPEPMLMDSEYLHDRLKKTSRTLKAVLLDQTVVAGIGNIYADESLFVARLHPAQLGCSITKPQSRRLRDAIQQVLTQAIEYRGSSIINYIGGSGLKGRFQNEFRVYGRAGLPCLVCGKEIMRIRLAGRSTHYCPKCQKPSRRLRPALLQ